MPCFLIGLDSFLLYSPHFLVRGRDRFRIVPARQGLSWSGLQADHVQDDSGFINLWPMDNSANMSAGARTNGQNITFCISSGSPMPYSGTFANAKTTILSIYGRLFVIRRIER